MAIAVITAWLQDPLKNDLHYKAGTALYEQYGKSTALKVVFRNGNGRSAYHRNRLVSALTELNAQAQEAPAPLSDEPVKIQKPGSTPKQYEPPLPVGKEEPVKRARYSLTDPEWEKAPERIKDLYVENKDRVSAAELAFFNLRMATSDAQRLQLAMTILDNRDQVNENWQIIKKYHATGELAKEITAKAMADVDKMSVPELLQVVRNYPTYISKDRPKLDGELTEQRRDKITKRIKEREATLELAKRRLANGGFVQE